MCARLESTAQRRYDTHEFFTFCYSGLLPPWTNAFAYLPKVHRCSLCADGVDGSSEVVFSLMPAIFFSLPHMAWPFIPGVHSLLSFLLSVHLFVISRDRHSYVPDDTTVSTI